MAKSRLAKSLDDTGWRQFNEMLANKPEISGQLVLKVKPHLTGIECSNCGHKFKKLLSQRQHNFPKFNLSIGRGLNAVINIKNRGKIQIKDLLPPIKFETYQGTQLSLF